MVFGRGVVDFNQELVFAEFGSLVCAPLVAFVVSLFTFSPSIISFSAVLGATVGGSVVWLSLRVRNQKRRNIHSRGKLFRDIMYFTPVAFLFTISVYQPLLFFISRFMIIGGYPVLVSVILAQFVAFVTFLLLLNVYKFLLWKFFGREL